MLQPGDKVKFYCVTAIYNGPNDSRSFVGPADGEDPEKLYHWNYCEVLYKVKEFFNNIYDEYNSIPKEELESWIVKNEDAVRSAIYDIAEVFGIQYLD